MISFSIDLEDPSERYDPNGRYVAMTRRILDMCVETNCRATFFTVGKIAEVAPQLIRDITARGHEIAYHSHAHVPLTQENPERFRREGQQDKDRMEQLAGKSITGFRAPAFSLTPHTIWALDILKELGFRYSSSIMPTRISRYGFPNAPRKPFKWPNGLLELPLPVARCGPLLLPYLGGIYMYAMPSALTRHWAKRADKNEILWTYTHPYDFDREEKFTRMPNTALWASFVLWVSRRAAEKKIRKVLGWGAAPTLHERAEALMSPGTYS
ncbi:MAG: polysaccharide deacetylase family protein [Alphaproteobacteria bacterium]|nr:polysaccharide deacetylase family protein [Alphaproteobacteria bacterium]